MKEALSVPGEASGPRVCTEFGKRVFRAKNTHTQWMPAESKTGQDFSGVIRQRTPELKSGGGNITFFFSIQSIRTSEITWGEAFLIMDCQSADSLQSLLSACKGRLALKIQNTSSAFWEI